MTQYFTWLLKIHKYFKNFLRESDGGNLLTLKEFVDFLEIGEFKMNYLFNECKLIIMLSDE